MLYLLDFDRTLFAVESLYAALAARGWDELVGTHESLERVPIADYVYEDVAPFLAAHGTESIILSSASGRSGEWETAYQRAKIDASGVAAQVREVCVVPGDKAAAAAEIAQRFPPDTPMCFVDDRIEHCLAVQAALPQATCCLMVRDPSVIGPVTSVQGMPVVHTLAALDAMIEL